MTRTYIQNHYSDIQKNANVIENRQDHFIDTQEVMIEKNEENLRLCKHYGHRIILIDKEYSVDLDL